VFTYTWADFSWKMYYRVNFPIKNELGQENAKLDKLRESKVTGKDEVKSKIITYEDQKKGRYHTIWTYFPGMLVGIGLAFKKLWDTGLYDTTIALKNVWNIWDTKSPTLYNLYNLGTSLFNLSYTPLYNLGSKIFSTSIMLPFLTISGEKELNNINEKRNSTRKELSITAAGKELDTLVDKNHIKHQDESFCHKYGVDFLKGSGKTGLTFTTRIDLSRLAPTGHAKSA